jgi:RNA polymerase sigma factor (sigma-70 family)
MTGMNASVEVARGFESGSSAHWLRHDRISIAHYSPRYDQHIEKPHLTSVGGLEAVLLKNRAALERFARARLRSEGSAEDLLQEMWIKVQQVDTGPIAEPLAYLYRMVNNLVLDRRRGETRRAARDFIWTDSQIEGSYENASDSAPSAEQVVIARDYLERVNQRLDALPERTAAIFRAVRIEKQPQKEIAALYEISVSAVEKHLQRAFREIVAVRAELEGETDKSIDQKASGIHHET